MDCWRRQPEWLSSNDESWSTVPHAPSGLRGFYANGCRHLGALRHVALQGPPAVLASVPLDSHRDQMSATKNANASRRRPPNVDAGACTTSIVVKCILIVRRRAQHEQQAPLSRFLSGMKPRGSVAACVPSDDRPENLTLSSCW